MGKRTGKIPVSEPVTAKAMDRQPFERVGDAWARNLSSDTMRKYAQREGMAEVWQTVMNKSVLLTEKGEEVIPSAMENNVPYIIQTQESKKNIGWVMRKDGAGVGRIYNKNIDSYEAMKNDPDRPHVLDNVDFDFMDEEEFDGFDIPDDNEYDGDFDGDYDY